HPREQCQQQFSRPAAVHSEVFERSADFSRMALREAWERWRPRRRVGRKLWKSAGETPALPGGTRLFKRHSTSVRRKVVQRTRSWKLADASVACSSSCGINPAPRFRNAPCPKNSGTSLSAIPETPAGAVPACSSRLGHTRRPV